MRAGDVVEDRFEIERLAGAGGMGDVYRARDRLSGEAVALKVLQGASADDLRRFTREAEAPSLRTRRRCRQPQQRATTSPTRRAAARRAERAYRPGPPRC
ncbi:hypothetical protein [Sorangium sp. So ce362]|uniref:hypothetical protein n=1 Tax=Sorangium sp. So ce362 TaxID=3133303 RepID=UPI003F61D961